MSDFKFWEANTYWRGETIWNPTISSSWQNIEEENRTCVFEFARQTIIWGSSSRFSFIVPRAEFINDARTSVAAGQQKEYNTHFSASSWRLLMKTSLHLRDGWLWGEENMEVLNIPRATTTKTTTCWVKCGQSCKGIGRCGRIQRGNNKKERTVYFRGLQLFPAECVCVGSPQKERRMEDIKSGDLFK